MENPLVFKPSFTGFFVPYWVFLTAISLYEVLLFLALMRDADAVFTLVLVLIAGAVVAAAYFSLALWLIITGLFLAALVLPRPGNLLFAVYMMMPAVAVTAVISAVISWLTVRLMPVHVYPDGISALNFWGVRRLVAWHDMTAVNEYGFMAGKRFARLYHTGEHRPVWLPLFMRDIDGFAIAVTDAAPEDNPLRRYINSSRRPYGAGITQA